MEDIIKIHTKENDLILDPFMGTGSACVAAKNVNRNYVGIELDKKYFKMAEKRLLKDKK
jgi:DNA modification methylase